MSERDVDSPEPKAGDILTIGDGLGRLAPLSDNESQRLGAILGKPLNQKAQAWLVDAIRYLIVLTVKGDAAPGLKDYEQQFRQMSDASGALLHALTPGVVRYELQCVIDDLEQFRADIERAHAAAENALRFLRPRTAKRGPKEDFVGKTFLRTLTAIASMVGADLRLPSHLDCDDPDGQRTPFFQFVQDVLYLAAEQARALSVTPKAIEELQNRAQQSDRRLLEKIEASRA
jgi:hypothetical protein